MAEAPKPQRVRRNRRKANGNKTEIDINLDTAAKPVVNGQKKRRRNRRRRPVFGPWLPGQGPRPRTRLRRAIKAELKKEGLEGPKVSVQQRVTSTFGLVGPNKSNNVELELNFFLHPSLAKEANDGTSFGPVQALAAQYALWKLKYLRLHFTPMVGASAVSGTVIRTSLNLSQSPGGTNWSGLGTRIHIDIHPGQATTFHLRGDQLGGPRDGGWWLTDTNEEGSQSAGPIVEVHTLGQTKSTFKDQNWTGPLFIVEGVGMWQFANYQVKPALGMLERRQAEVPVTITATAGEPIMMEMPVENAVTTFMINAEPEVFAVPSTNSVGETIFQVVDVGADLASAALPPPFGWLIKGGWWFLKRVFGKARDGNASFYIYPSLADAQNDRPAIAGAATTSSGTANNAELIVTQINSPNVGPQPTASAMIRASVPVPMNLGMFRLHSSMFPLETVNWQVSGQETDGYFPTSFFAGMMQQLDSGTPTEFYLQTNWFLGAVQNEIGNGEINVQKPSVDGSFVHVVYRLLKPRFSDLTGNVEYIPPLPKSGAALYFGNSSGSTGTYHRVGEVVATAVIHHGETEGNAFLNMTLHLVRTTKREPDRLERRGQHLVRTGQGSATDKVDRTRVKFVSVKEASVDAPVNLIRTIGFDENEYLLCASFAAATSTIQSGPPIVGRLKNTLVDLAIRLPFRKPGGTGSDYTTDTFFRLDNLTGVPMPPNPLPTQLPSVPYYLGGYIFPAYSVDINLNYVGKPEIPSGLLDQLMALGVQFQNTQISDSESDSDDEYISDAAKEYLQMLLSMGRLSNRSEIAFKTGDYVEALRIHKSEQ